MKTYVRTKPTHNFSNAAQKLTRNIHKQGSSNTNAHTHTRPEISAFFFYLALHCIAGSFSCYWHRYLMLDHHYCTLNWAQFCLITVRIVHIDRNTVAIIVYRYYYCICLFVYMHSVQCTHIKRRHKLRDLWIMRAAKAETKSEANRSEQQGNRCFVWCI